MNRTDKNEIVFSQELMENYFQSLVNQFFKILPIREGQEPTLATYIDSLQLELFGLKELIPEASQDPMLLRLISILQYFKDNPECSVQKTRREVFKAIAICNKLKATYSESEVVSNE